MSAGEQSFCAYRCTIPIPFRFEHKADLKIDAPNSFQAKFELFTNANLFPILRPRRSICVKLLKWRHMLPDGFKLSRKYFLSGKLQFLRLHHLTPWANIWEKKHAQKALKFSKGENKVFGYLLPSSFLPKSLWRFSRDFNRFLVKTFEEKNSATENKRNSTFSISLPTQFTIGKN